MKRLVYFLMTILCAVFGIVDASAMCAADGGTAAAAGAAAINNEGLGAKATPGVDDAGVHVTTSPNNGLTTDMERLGSPDFIDDPVDKEVVKMFQSAIPVDQICRHIPSAKQDGMRYSFWSIDTKPIKTEVSEALGSVSGTGEAGDPFVYIGTNDTATLKVENGDMFDPTDQISIPSIAGYVRGTATLDAGVPLSLYVIAVNGNNLTVMPINGKVSGGHNVIPYIADGTVIYRLGHAASEGDVQTTPYAGLPVPDEFYMQIFKAQILESTISMDSKKKVHFSFSDQQQLALYELRREIECSYILGVKGFFYNATTKRYVYTCSGIIQQIIEKGTVISYNYSDEWTEATLLTSIVKPIFLNNSGSATRYLFGGSDLISKIAVVPGIQRQIGATQVLRKFGIDWKTLQFMSWQINAYQHPLLDELGLAKSGFVLDLPYVRKNTFRSLTETALGLIEAGLFDGKSNVWTEISSIGLKYPKCHAFIREASEFNPQERL